MCHSGRGHFTAPFSASSHQLGLCWTLRRLAADFGLLPHPGGRARRVCCTSRTSCTTSLATPRGRVSRACWCDEARRDGLVWRRHCPPSRRSPCVGRTIRQHAAYSSCNRRSTASFLLRHHSARSSAV